MFSSAACLRPGADSPERLKLVADLKSRTAAAYTRLKHLADFDHDTVCWHTQCKDTPFVLTNSCIAEPFPTHGSARRRVVARTAAGVAARTKVLDSFSWDAHLSGIDRHLPMALPDAAPVPT